MTLREYLFYNKISITRFSLEIGCSRIHLSEVISGRRKPSLFLAKLIESVTEKQVPASSFFNP